MKGTGSALFVAILLTIAGSLNIIYGIAAVDNAHFFDDTEYVFSSLNTWGWITVILGVLQMIAGISLFGGGTFGRAFGIVSAGFGAVAALLSVGGTHPFWSLGVFAICLIVIHGLAVYGEPETR
jgi:hypothetical protein